MRDAQFSQQIQFRDTNVSLWHTKLCYWPQHALPSMTTVFGIGA
jgi:hypothetical protein